MRIDRFQLSIRLCSLCIVLGSWPAISPAQQLPPVRLSQELFISPRTINAEKLLTDLENRKKVEAWRKQFAYKSLANRLKYERRARKSEPPILLEQTRHWLDRREDPNDFTNGRSALIAEQRSRALRLLHTATVDEFISATGFGVSRFPMMASSWLMMTNDDPPVSAEKVPPLSSASESNKELSLPVRSNATGSNPYLLPSNEQLVEFVLRSQTGFAYQSDFGDVKNVNEVSGFESHGFNLIPFAPRDDFNSPPNPDGRPMDGEKQWKVARLELVSLLRHAVPAVYLSEHLPRMEDLKDAKTRPLSQFEADSLAKLREGEDVQARSTGNRIEMLGSIRAAKQCLDCHQVPRGTLLGAFSYQLQRDPPMKAPVATPSSN